MDERRKNPARKKAPEITYLVALDVSGKCWNIMRNGVATGAYAPDKSTAVDQASHAASAEQAETEIPLTVWSFDSGKRTKEWPND
jgi:hypothetical protein